MHCSKCQHFGHHRVKCRADKQVCSGCGGEHENKACDQWGITHCTNCKADDHQAHSRSCPTFKHECKKLNVVNSTKALKLIPTFLKFFQSIYVPVFDHVTPALILAELPL
jgi:hypothetical protein